MVSLDGKGEQDAADEAEAQPDWIPWTPARVRVTAALMVTLLVAAMDGTIVATALPTIASELGGFSLYPWVISAYLLTSTTAVPIWGRLADLQGRKRVLMAGLAVFVAASALCGVAPNMPALIAFRAAQGVGAASLLPVALTTVGDLFPTAQRARLQGLFSSAWAVAALTGPLLGSIFVSTVGWRWIFFVNLPIGAAAGALLAGFHDRPAASPFRRPLDYRGAVLLTTGVAVLLLGLGSGRAGTAVDWRLLAAGGAFLVVFLWFELRSRDPTVPLRLLRSRLIGPATLAAVLAGTLMFGINAYVPLYVQGALGGTPYEAGAALAAASLSWTLASMTLARMLVRLGHQPLMVGGGVCMVTGMGLLLAAPAGQSVGWTAFCMALVGFGMGLLQTPILIVIQGAVDWSVRGSVTALNLFSRTLGGAVGIPLLGLLLQSRLTAAGSSGAISAGDNPLSGGTVSEAIRPALDRGLLAVFGVLLILAVAVLGTSLAILVVSRTRPATGPSAEKGGLHSPRLAPQRRERGGG